MKIIKLLGIRKRAILTRFPRINGMDYAVLIPLTKEQYVNLDKEEIIEINNKSIDKKNIYAYGEININLEEDVNYIKKFRLIDSDNGGNMYSTFDYTKGEATFEEIVKTKNTFDSIEWFKYNYCLIGKPDYILIYKCKKEDL